jgi:hypothetical protein
MSRSSCEKSRRGFSFSERRSYSSNVEYREIIKLVGFNLGDEIEIAEVVVGAGKISTRAAAAIEVAFAARSLVGDDPFRGTIEL